MPLRFGVHIPTCIEGMMYPVPFARPSDILPTAFHGLMEAGAKPGSTVYIGGDFNIGYKADNKVRDKRLPYRRFTALGMTSIWKDSPYLEAKRGTHADALIDQIWTTASPASVRSLELQGGWHSPSEALDFEKVEFYSDAVNLRRWDDRAKIPNLKTRALANYTDLLRGLCR